MPDNPVQQKPLHQPVKVEDKSPRQTPLNHPAANHDLSKLNANLDLRLSTSHNREISPRVTNQAQPSLSTENKLAPTPLRQHLTQQIKKAASTIQISAKTDIFTKIMRWIERLIKMLVEIFIQLLLATNILNFMQQALPTKLAKKIESIRDKLKHYRERRLKERAQSQKFS
jgi:hypothetical protein